MFNFILDLLFPQKPLVRELERMDALAFIAQTGRTLERAGTGILSVFDYREPLVRTAIWELKYRGNGKVATLLAEILYDELLAFLEEYAPLTNFTDPLLIPIPLSHKRESERGFNQCRLLANELMRLDSSSFSSSPRGDVASSRQRSSGEGGISPKKGSTAVSCLRRSFGRQVGRRGVADLSACAGRNFTLCLNGLHKIKHTESQTKQDTRKKRLENLKGCFTADAESVKGRNIILIDDVATTGATIEEAKRALRKAGARKVIAFTVAH